MPPFINHFEILEENYDNNIIEERLIQNIQNIQNIQSSTSIHLYLYIYIPFILFIIFVVSAMVPFPTF
jgi:hypothetical protein